MIELPGHEAIIPNVVFARPTSDFAAKYLTILYLFDESKPSEVWDYLQRKVEGLVAVKSFGYEPKSELEKFISKLPENIQKNFAAYQEKYKEYCTYDIKEGSKPRRSLQICHGVMPLETLAEGNGDPYWYLKSMFELRNQDDSPHDKDYKIGEQVYIALALRKSGLPKKEQVEKWVCGEKAPSEKIFQILPEESDPEEVLPLINLVYDALGTANFKKLRVLTELEDLAVSTMRGILADIKFEKRMEE